MLIPNNQAFPLGIDSKQPNVLISRCILPFLALFVFSNFFWIFCCIKFHCSALPPSIFHFNMKLKTMSIDGLKKFSYRRLTMQTWIY